MTTRIQYKTQKKTHNLNNIQVAHMGLEPKSSHIIKVLSTT